MITLRDQTVGTFFPRLVGVAFGVIGLGLAALAGFIVWISMEPGLAALLIVVVSIALFCTLTGLRLALNKPNRYGSVIRPWAWRTLAAAFLLLAISLVVFDLMQEKFLSAGAAVVAVALALLCFFRARTIGQQKKAIAALSNLAEVYVAVSTSDPSVSVVPNESGPATQPNGHSGFMGPPGLRDNEGGPERDGTVTSKGHD